MKNVEKEKRKFPYAPLLYRWFMDLSVLNFEYVNILAKCPPRHTFDGWMFWKLKDGMHRHLDYLYVYASAYLYQIDVWFLKKNSMAYQLLLFS